MKINDIRRERKIEIVLFGPVLTELYQQIEMGSLRINC